MLVRMGVLVGVRMHDSACVPVFMRMDVRMDMRVSVRVLDLSSHNIPFWTAEKSDSTAVDRSSVTLPRIHYSMQGVKSWVKHSVGRPGLPCLSHTIGSWVRCCSSGRRSTSSGAA